MGDRWVHGAKALATFPECKILKSKCEACGDRLWLGKASESSHKGCARSLIWPPVHVNHRPSCQPIRCRHHF